MTGEASGHAQADKASALAPTNGKPTNNGQHGCLDAFTNDLGQLRHAAGQPSLRRMSQRAHYSHTALSGVLSGTRLPSLDLTLAFVRACGGDEDAWRARWQLEHDRIRSVASPPAQAGAVPTPTAPGPRFLSPLRSPTRLGPGRGIAIVGAVVLLLTAITITSMAWQAEDRTEESSGVALSPVDGADPKDAKCDLDAVSATTVDVMQRADPGGIFGYLTLRYSRRCQAAWPLYMSTPLVPAGVTIHLETLRPSDGTTAPFDYPSAVGSTVFDVYGNVLRTTQGCLSAVVDIRDASGRDSLAAGSTPCLNL